MAKLAVKITQAQLLEAATKIAEDNKVLARVLVVLHQMRLEPAVNSDTAWIHKPSGSVKDGDKLGLEVKAKLKDLNFDADLVDVLVSLKDAKSQWEGFLDVVEGLARKALNEFTLWLETFYELGATRWSEVDDQCWGDTMHSWDDEGRKIIVVPSERRNGGKEYKVVALDPNDIISNAYGRTESLADNVNKYFTKNMVKATKTHLYDEKTYPVDKITGKYLSAAAIDSGILAHTLVTNNLDGKAIGLRLAPGGDGLDNKMLTPAAYLKRTFVNLIANKDRQIEHISAISNDPEEPTLCYVRKDYTVAECPTWMKWIEESFKNPNEDKDYFMAWCGSLLDAKNTGKQACYIHGFGNMGASKVSGALSKVLGSAATAISGSKSMTNQFGTAKLEGKRLVVVADNKNTKILMTEWVHNLTGGDIVDVERKGKDSHAAKLIGKLLICGNVPPEINFDEQNQKSRCLYIPLKRLKDSDKAKMSNYRQREDGSYIMVGDASFGQRLEDEAEAFLGACWAVYERLAPTRADILISADKEAAMEAELTDTETFNIARLMDTCFEFGEDDEFTAAPDEVYETYKSEAKMYGLSEDNSFYGGRIKAYLLNRGVEFVSRKAKRVDGKVTQIPAHLRGIRIKK